MLINSCYDGQPQVMESDPPFHETFQTLFSKSVEDYASESHEMVVTSSVKERELPLIDLRYLNSCEEDARRRCELEIARASRDWGFFQVVNHGISKEVVESMRREQVKVFKQPFQRKFREDKFMNFSPGSYRWGTPSATCAAQFSWLEAFHVPVADILASSCPGNTRLSCTMEQFSATVSTLAKTLIDILAANLGHKSDFITASCIPTTCYLRLNRYPPCPISSMFGLMPHTDSDFLTILHQDQVGGLQLVKDGEWVAVKPNPDALIVNIGDLFQAWSNDVYKSVEHRVVTNPTEERFSAAYFLCPSYDTVIKSCEEPSVYRNFSFGEYRQQVQVDVKNLGHKMGLSRFRNAS